MTDEQSRDDTGPQNPGKPPPRHLNPFSECINYRKAHWFGTLPLPARQKNPPPTGFTGHNAPWPRNSELQEWLADPTRKRANICLRLGGVDDQFEVIGIDVDHYHKGGKEKRGGDQLQALENAHGKLPQTWISSARTDGVSGIRYYRVPRGLAFRGQVDKDIECIQKGHRFAVVWPSFNPDSQTYYWWFPPGAELTQAGRRNWTGKIPDAATLPSLPDQWIDFLTQGRIKASDVEIDMDSSVDTIYKWADETLPEQTTLCSRMREKMEKHVRLMETEATSHDKIVNAHMNIFHLAQEGHTGWAEAVNQLEAKFVEVCAERDKREPHELRGEIFRSRSRGLRRIKAQIDAQISMGAQGVPSEDIECSGSGLTLPVIGEEEIEGAFSGLNDVPRGTCKPIPDYEQTDDGNAQHFRDMFSNKEIGPAFRYIDGYGWIVWHDGDDKNEPHWERDRDGDGIIRRMWQLVKTRQMDYADKVLKAEYTKLARAYASQGGAAGAGGATQAEVKEAKSVWTNYLRFAMASGNNRGAKSAIEALRSVPGVSMRYDRLDSTPDTLAVANGVVELGPGGPTLRRAQAEDYLTMNTGVPWLDASGVSTVGARLWQDYLEKFLPNEEYRKDVQIGLGHCLLGGNPHKKLFVLQGASNTGKSVIISMINAVLGDYASTVNKSLLQYHKLNPVLALALPKRVVSIIELSRDTKNALTIDQIKTATGNDSVQVELKGSNEPIERMPFFVPFIVTNTVPNIEGADKALKERIHLYKFEVIEEYPDDSIAARMRVESKTAVLNWLIEGYSEYCRIGRRLPVNEQMRKAKEDFAADFDEISAFVKDRLEAHPHYSNMAKRWQDSPEWLVTPASLYEAYQTWCVAQNIKDAFVFNAYKFSMRIGELGFSKKVLRVNAKKSDRYWVGLKIKKTEAQSLIEGIRLQSRQE